MTLIASSLALKNSCRAAVNEHFRSNCASLYNAAVGSKIALEDSDSACFAVWVVDRTNDLRVLVYAACDVFAYGLACAGEAVCVDEVLFGKLAENRINAAGFIKILHVCVTGRSKVAEVRCLCAYLVSHVEVYLDPALVCDSGEVEHTVCGAAQSHVSSKSVVESLFRHDVARTDILAGKAPLPGIPASLARRRRSE